MPQEPKTKGNDANNALAIVRIWAMTLYLPRRRYVGKDHVGFGGLLGIVFVFFYTGLMNGGPLIFLIPILMLHLFCSGISRCLRRRQGIVEHTEYGGEPWIAMRLFFTNDEWFAKQFGEPAIIAGLGFVIYRWWPAAATYFFWGASAMILNHMLLRQADQRYIDRMNNAQIEADHFMNGSR